MATYRWCLHCERTFRKGTERRHVYDGYVMLFCPYDGCDGSEPGDLWSWAEVRKGREDRYPEEPTPGVVYPLYEGAT